MTLQKKNPTPPSLVLSALQTAAIKRMDGADRNHDEATIFKLN